ncbi:hypothetical protein AVEN_129723-1 [Araneus ventricosus]|uniref:Uncharacterized protein n=1 Tax=Araneus ventricosus TaxID=182803 RepID=A0A4Y2DI17_ARAVE|nr:hypothetical protein AVEN_129723-1 [Araneus ventricosus]
MIIFQDGGLGETLGLVEIDKLDSTLKAQSMPFTVKFCSAGFVPISTWTHDCTLKTPKYGLSSNSFFSIESFLRKVCMRLIRISKKVHQETTPRKAAIWHIPEVGDFLFLQVANGAKNVCAIPKRGGFESLSEVYICESI